MKKLFAFVSMFVYMFWVFSFANTSFMDSSIHSIVEYNLEKDSCDMHEVEAHDDHIDCVTEISDYWKDNTEEDIPDPKFSEQTYLDFVQLENLEQKSFLNKDPPKITANKTFSFADMVGIVLMLN